MKVTAVIVTFNRLVLLQKTLDYVRMTPLVTHIIVVNNGSTDGTTEWLDTQADLEVIHQDNVGGSGGFYTGMKAAYEGGSDWIWCMADDVCHRPDCLNFLIEATCTASVSSARDASWERRCSSPNAGTST